MPLFGGYRSFAEPDDPGNDPWAPNPVTPAVPVTPFPTQVYNPTPVTPPVVVPPKGGGGGGQGLGIDINSFPDYDFGPTPRFNAPRFTAPTADEVLGSPDYQTRLKSGTDALERSAAARGTLRTGGTLKDVIDYGKKFGQGEYDSSFNHALQGFQANYQGARDEFAPLLASYQLRAQAALQKALAIYGRGTEWNNPHAGGGGGAGPLIPPPPTPPDVNSFSKSEVWPEYV